MRSARVIISACATALLALSSAGRADGDEYFSGSVVNSFGSKVSLEVRKSGARLTFDLAFQSGTTTLDGTPKCDSADIKPDGTFSTYCAGFGNGVAGTNSRTRLAGTLSLAKLDNVPRSGGADIPLAPGRLAKR